MRHGVAGLRGGRAEGPGSAGWPSPADLAYYNPQMNLRAVCLALSGLALILILLSGPLTRLGLVHFRTGLLLFGGALIFAIGAFTISLVALIVPRLRGDHPQPLVIALIMSLVVMAGPAVFVQKARGVPAIHDISTDTENPPVFIDVVPLRQAAGAANPPEYAGAAVAAQQLSLIHI